MAIAVAMMPHVSGLLIVKWNAMIGAFGAAPDKLSDPEFLGAMAQGGSPVPGHMLLSQGSIITGMIWGAFTALIIDGKFQPAGWFAVAAAAMSSVGILHSAQLQAPTFSPVVIGYLIVGAFLLIYPRVAEVKPLHEGDFAEEHDGETPFVQD